MVKTNQEIAKEIIQGKWGNNAERKRRLTEAGYDYEKVQSLVEAIINDIGIEEALRKAREYDAEHGVVELEILGTETMEIEVDLNKYNSIKLMFVSGDKNVQLVI